MNYPLISEYIEAIKSAEDNFKELTNLCPVHGDDGQPVMTSGNFAVVFKMQDIETEASTLKECPNSVVGRLFQSRCNAFVISGGAMHHPAIER